MASATASASLTNATTGTGTTVDFTTAKNRVTALVSVSGTSTGGVVAIEASHDGTIWVTRHVIGCQTARNLSHDNDLGAYRYWRARVVDSVRGGGTITVTFMEAD